MQAYAAGYFEIEIWANSLGRVTLQQKSTIWNTCWLVKPWENFFQNYRSQLTYNWITDKNYTNFEDLCSALEDGKVEGVLLDT